MNTIYKYQIPVKETHIIELPMDAQIIRVGAVEGICYLWAIVDTEKEFENRHIECYKTGQPIETPLDHLVYLGTCKLIVMEELCLYVFENIMTHTL